MTSEEIANYQLSLAHHDDAYERNRFLKEIAYQLAKLRELIEEAKKESDEG